MISNFVKTALLLLFLAFAAYGQQQERVAIIQTLDDGDSIKPTDLAYLTDKLRETAVNVLPKRYGVMTTESIVAFLGSQERAMKECKEASCLAELGRKVNADYVAQGRIGRFNKNLTIKVELYDSKKGNLVGSFTSDSKDIVGLRDIINEKAPDLFNKMLSTSNFVVVPQQQSTNMEQRAKVQWYINNGVEKHKEEIKREALSLSYMDRTDLYNENKKSNLGYFALNVVPGFGFGSYIQGDIRSGIIFSIADIIGWGLGMWAYQLYNESKSTDDPYYGYSDGFNLVYSYYFGFFSAITLVGNRVFGWMITSNYAKKYNKSLDVALNSNNNVSYSIDPLIVPRDGTPAVGLVFNLRY
ncbi:MAG: hypothetical protein LBC64_03740 [Fibromonadaceae bacterium]|jgi:TolB-like protein|nr:hypothetical protein [Fibromonadaceae bacterium]